MNMALIVPHRGESFSFWSEQKGQTGPWCLWWTISSRLWGEIRSLLSGLSLLKGSGVVHHSQYFLELKLNITCKTILEKKVSAVWCKRPLLLSILWQISWQHNYLLGIPAKDLIVTCVITPLVVETLEQSIGGVLILQYKWPLSSGLLFNVCVVLWNSNERGRLFWRHLSQINSLSYNGSSQRLIFHKSIHYLTCGSWKPAADHYFKQRYQLSVFRKMDRA